MSRHPRKLIKTCYFHVMIQGINKSYIFEKEKDIKYYIKIMYKFKNENNIRIIAYCIMNNHAHILIETNEIKNLSTYMHKINTLYGLYYNRINNRVGYVFRDRYKSEGIYDQKHLFNCIKYIYNNPVKAGICREASEYPFSNYKKINGNYEEQYNFIDTDEDKNNQYKIAIRDYLISNNISMIDIKNNEKKLKLLVKLLKDKYNLSLRRISKEINVDREKIRKIYAK